MDDAFELRHGFGVECGPHHVAGKEEARVGVVDDVVNLLGFELVENGNHDGAVADCGQKGNCPVGTVAAADGDFVARLDAGRLKENVEFLDFARHILVLEGYAFVVGECVEVPMVDDALFNETDEVFVMVFHEE